MTEQLVYICIGFASSLLMTFVVSYLKKTDSNALLYHSVDKRLALVELSLNMMSASIQAQSRVIEKMTADINEAFVRIKRLPEQDDF